MIVSKKKINFTRELIEGVTIMQRFRGLIVIAMLSSNLTAANTSQNLTHQISQQYVNVINKNNEALNH